MSMGVVSKENFDSELASLRKDEIKSERAQVEILDTPGRKEGDNNVPDSLRKIIGDTALTEGRQEAIALARSFGLSESSASAYVNGSTSTKSYNKPDRGLLAHINKKKESISRRAHSTLNSAIKEITPEKLKELKPRDLAGVAKDMSVVIKNMEPENKEQEGSSAPQFLIYAPQFKKEEHFHSIHLDE